MKAIDVVISGRVQAVGFRAFTRKNAVMLGIRGYVENLSDGKVHAIFEGEDYQIEKLLELIRHGPRMSQVRDIRVIAAEMAGYKAFDIR